MIDEIDLGRKDFDDLQRWTTAEIKRLRGARNRLEEEVAILRDALESIISRCEATGADDHPSIGWAVRSGKIALSKTTPESAS